MKKSSVCFRCHQKCSITVEVENGKITEVWDATKNQIPPCVEACPINMDVPGYLMAVAQGKFDEAMGIIRETNPLPHVCGRVCHHPCELDCNKNVIDEPIAIASIKRLVADHSLKSAQESFPVQITRKENVAIIGSGPAGLTAAHDLVKAGYSVTIYESAPVPGGMLSRIIPEFKLPLSAVQTDIDYIRGLGVRIKTSTPVGANRTVDRLLREYSAVLVAVGCWKARPLSLPGSDLNGIYDGLAVLQDAREDRKIRVGRKAVVIGGGDAAITVARAALRLGAAEVHISCLEHRRAMPAKPWEIEKAEKEGVVLHPALAPQRFKGDREGRVTIVDFRKVAYSETNRYGEITWELQEGSGTECSMEADTVIVAIGQGPRADSLWGDRKPEVTPRGTLVVHPDTLATSVPGLFAAGDVVLGAGNITEGMAQGRKAASSIIRYLGGGEIPKAGIRKPSENGQGPAVHFTVKEARQKMPVLDPVKALKSFQEVELGYSESVGVEEARRCINCVTVCPKGMTIPDVMYHRDRLLYPMKRAGERGEGKWERISWEEALSTIAGKLKEIKEKYGPEAIHISTGSGQKHFGLQAAAIARKMWPAPNVHWGRYTCILPDRLSNKVTFGDMLTYEYGPDYAHSKCIVFWGSEPDVGTPAQAREVNRGIRDGAKLMVIDPRPIPRARRADLWLKIRPGTDAALALAMQNVVIHEGLYDKEFVSKYCFGFDKLRQHVQQYTPAWAAKLTDLAEEDIIAAARMYAKNTPGCIYIRCGAGAQQVHSTQISRAIINLLAICGNVDVPGGNLLWERTYTDALSCSAYDIGFSFKGPAAVEAKQIGAEEYPLLHKGSICDMPGTVRAMADGRIKALWCVANNLIVSEGDARKIFDSMRDKVDFTFVSEYFMTPGAELADVVLPAAFYHEVDTIDAAFVYPSNHIRGAKKIVEPPGECRDDREVAIDIAKRMGMDVAPWNSVREYLDWMLKYKNMTFDELCDRPGSKIIFPREFKRYERSTPPFYTPSGKVELYSTIFEYMGLDPIPVYEEPPEGPLSTPEIFKKFPLIYVHYRIYGFMHTEGRQIERQRQFEPDACLEMNPETGRNLGIEDGDQVLLETPHSADKWHLTFKARFLPDMHPSVVAGPHGWWFPEKPGPEHGCFDSNINALLTLDPPYDPVVGNVQCRALICRVWKDEAR